MKNGRAHFGRPPMLRLASFQAILSAVQATGIAGIAPAIMAKKRSELIPMQANANMRKRELWMIYHETRKNDPSIRDVCRWIETAFSNLR